MIALGTAGRAADMLRTALVHGQGGFMMRVMLARDRKPGLGAGGGGREGAGGPGEPARRDRRWVRLLMLLGLAGVLGAGAASAAAALGGTPHPVPGQLPRPAGIPVSISTRLANLMQLSALPRRAAPGFTLTDQNGRTMSLSGLRGKVVVLEFMDPHCTDICPIVSQEFVDAYHDLGPLASKVVFAAVNVNQYFRSVPAVATFSAEHELTMIPGWHFFTGSTAALSAVWRGYQVDVRAPNPSGDIVHNSPIYFIGRDGTERYLAVPEGSYNKPRFAYRTRGETGYLPAGQMTEWARGIAVLARGLAR
jgi:cytochrome oxidase Cu insertion factor (SCO1/SenC/PrrC family)